MQSFNDTNAVWDLPLSQSLPSIADDEFIALLQKQFGVNQEQLDRSLFSPIKDASAAPPLANVDPQSLTTRLPTPPATSTPSSEDSSPSPPSMPAEVASGSRSKRQSGVYPFDAGSGSRNNDRSSDDEPAPKRKAGSEDHDDEPDPKAQHTCSFSTHDQMPATRANSRKTASASKKASSSRRKSSGNPDESRLMKRKEQNRAAQRAFRERKEKHVKDLEDKVAALEEKNSEAVAENESLREVITRLQSENMRLRNSSFTFSMPSSTDKQTPKDAAPSTSGAQRQQSQQDSPMTVFNSPPSVTSSATASTHDSPQSLFINDQNEGGSLSFLNSGLRVLDSEPQQTATAAADSMGIDFGFDPIMTQPYTTIASNPMFMSFREPDHFSFDQANGLGSTYPPANQMSNMQPFDFSQAFSSWPDVNMDDVQVNGSFDELFGGASYLGQLGGNDFNFSKSPATSLSPVSHHNSNKSSSISITSGSSSSGSTPASTSSNAASPTNGTESAMSVLCPKPPSCSKANIEDCLARDPGSVFAPRPEDMSSLNASMQSLENDICPEEVPCKGLKLPKTQRSEKNVEVMNAWRAIRHDPNYQDADINSLCSEFASKAKCDGCQVVLEPEGLQEILDLVAKQKMSKQTTLNGSKSSISKATGVIAQ